MAKLQATIVSARNLKNKETFGKQDPYVLLSLTLEERDFKKGPTHKDGGVNPFWTNANISLQLPNNPNLELYVEIYDEDPTTDEIIGFAAIPLEQVRRSPSGAINAFFDVFLSNGRPHGEIQLILSLSGQYPHNVIKGQSYVNQNHLKRVKSKEMRNTAAEAGLVIGGGLLAAGAGMLAQKYLADQKKGQQPDPKRPW